MTFSDGAGGGTSLCTGTLLNTASGPVAPYFYTAAHCISTQASAGTLTTHWFYDRTACGSGGTSASYVQVAGGATLLYANASSDASLLRLNQNPPAERCLRRLGREHRFGRDGPDGGASPGRRPEEGEPGQDGRLRVGRLRSRPAASSSRAGLSTTTGVTEGGSSGSGIFSALGQPATQYLLRGGLLGGPSSCTASAVDLYDYYSRLDQVYACIAEHLSPAPGCSYSLSSAGASLAAPAGSGSFSVSTSSACSWGAMSQANWITTNNCGSGGGTVTYSVAANTGSSARTGTITVGGQTFTITQAGQPATGTNVLANGGFESGTASWTESAIGRGAHHLLGHVRAHSGSGYAWLGGYVSATDSIYQNVAIPAGASPVTLQFWYRIVTAETTSSERIRHFRVTIQNPYERRDPGYGGQPVRTSMQHPGWVQSAAFDLSAFAGQTVRLRFTATNDASNITSFLVDDIVLNAASAAGRQLHGAVVECGGIGLGDQPQPPGQHRLRHALHL